MPFDAGSIVGHITLDSSGYQSGANAVKEHSKGMAGEMLKAEIAFELLRKASEFVIDVLKESSKRFIEAERTEAQLNAVLKSTHEIAGMTRTSILALADSLAKQTTFEKDAIVGAENLLLTFTNIGKNIFPQATETVLNMATALGEDLKSASIQLGKALQDPILGVTALRRVGVNFNQTQTDMIKGLVNSGQTLKAQQMILKELNTEFGGSARAVRDTFGGSVAAAKNSWIEFQETLGSYEAKVGRPIAESFITMTNGMTDFLKSAEGMKDIEAVASGAAQAFTIIKLVAQSLIDVVGKSLKSILDNVGTALGTVGGKGKETATAFSILNSVVYMLEIGFTIIAKVINLVITVIADLVKDITTTVDLLGKFATAMKDPLNSKGWEAAGEAASATGKAFVNTGADLINNLGDIVQSTYDMFSKGDAVVTKMTDNMIKESKRAADGIKASFASVGVEPPAAKGTTGGKVDTTTAGAMDFSGRSAGAGEHGGGGALHGSGQASGELTGAESDKQMTDMVNGWADSYNKITNIVGDAVGKIQGIWNKYYDAQLTNIENEYKGKADALDADYAAQTSANDKSTASDKDKAAKQTAIDKAYADKKTALAKEQKEKEAVIKKQQFEANKAASIVSTIISGIQGAMASFAQFGYPWGLIPAAIMAGITAVEVGMIASQPTPAFAAGGDAKPGWAKVGERGTELVHFGAPAHIYSNADSQGLMGGKSINQTNNFGDIHNVDDLDRLTESQARIFRSLVRSV